LQFGDLTFLQLVARLLVGLGSQFAHEILRDAVEETPDNQRLQVVSVVLLLEVRG